MRLRGCNAKKLKRFSVKPMDDKGLWEDYDSGVCE